VAEMQALIETLAPSDANVIVAAPATQAINVDISGLIPDTAAVRDAVVAELKAMFMRRAEPASITENFVFARSWIDEAVAMAPKWERSSIVVPTANVVISTPGVLPVLGTVRFV